MSDSIPASSAKPSAATSETAPGSQDAFLSSGQSPGDRPTLHLIGPGQVGRAFLRQLRERADDALVVAVSDSSGTAYAREGLPVDALLAHKAEGSAIAAWPGAEAIPTELAIRVVSADLVVDATPSGAEGTDAAILRGKAALQSGASLALCSKNALARKAAEWLSPATRQRLGVNAVLGGTGAQLVQELDELRSDCSGLALVGNVTTTAIVTAVERGASIEEGIQEAQRLGFLEPDADLDLDGSDAAVKLLCVWSAVFGETFCEAPSFDAVEREDVRALDATALQERAARGATTRLIARAGRNGGDLRVGFEEVALGSPLAAPADRVVYGYELPSGLRVHTGLGVGYERTAEALWGDVAVLLQEVSR